MQKIKAIILLVIIIIFFYYTTAIGILLPEKNLNFEFQDLKSNDKVYVLISEDLLNYNLEHEIEHEKNTTATTGLITQESYKKIKDFYTNKDYIGYANYYNRKCRL